MSIADKKLNIKSIVLITVILPVVVIILSSIAIVITASSAVEQKTFDMSLVSNITPEIEKAPETPEEALIFTEKVIDTAVGSGILKFDGNTYVSVENIMADNESLKNILSYASSSLSEGFSSQYEGISIKYGENAKSIKELLPETVPDEAVAEITDGRLTVRLIYSEFSDNMYFLSKDRTAIERFSYDNSSVFSSDESESAKLQKYEYVLYTDCATGRIISLEINRVYDYSSYITFVASLSDIGSSSVGMTLSFSEVYNFSYAGIEIAQDYVTLTRNGYEALSVSAFTETGLSEDEYKLEFISSDESVATVDENGQVEAVAISDKPVRVEVKLTYLGREFSDSCTVYVVNETESIKISESELTLKAGESFILSAEVKPDNATVKTVDYYSSDETVAKVSSDGKITALGEGNAVIYAVTRQGLLSAECRLSVTK